MAIRPPGPVPELRPGVGHRRRHPLPAAEDPGRRRLVRELRRGLRPRGSGGVDLARPLLRCAASRAVEGSEIIDDEMLGRVVPG